MKGVWLSWKGFLVIRFELGKDLFQHFFCKLATFNGILVFFYIRWIDQRRNGLNKDFGLVSYQSKDDECFWFLNFGGRRRLKCWIWRGDGRLSFFIWTCIFGQASACGHGCFLVQPRNLYNRLQIQCGSLVFQLCVTHTNQNPRISRSTKKQETASWPLGGGGLSGRTTAKLEPSFVQSKIEQFIWK